MKYVFTALLIVGVIPSAMAQAGSPPAWSPAKSIGMFAYPKNKQTADQQLKDESDCYGSARQNTGVDPQAPAPTGPSAQQQQAAQQQAAQQAGKGRGQGGQCRVPQEVLLLPRLRAMREREQPSAPRWARSPAGASSGCQNRKLRSKLLSKQPRRNNRPNLRRSRSRRAPWIRSREHFLRAWMPVGIRFSNG